VGPLTYMALTPKGTCVLTWGAQSSDLVKSYTIANPETENSVGTPFILTDIWRITIHENRIEIKIRSQFDRRGKEKKVWRRSASRRPAELQCLARASEALVD
jgi:hypothetical protein